MSNKDKEAEDQVDNREEKLDVKQESVQNTSESLHDALVRQANQENQEEILKEVRKHITKVLIERKALVRQMEQLDMQCSALDAKIESLTTAYSEGQLITKQEVSEFMVGPTFNLAIGSMGEVGIDLESFNAHLLKPVKRKIHPRM